MAFTHVAGTPQSALSAALAIPYPAGVAAGQLLVVVAAVRDYNGATGITAPSGFTLKSTSSPGTNDTLWMYERIADGTESGTVTFDTGTTAGQQAIMLSFPPRAGRRWPAAGAFVAATEGDTAGGSTMTYNARTIGATNRLGLQIAKEPTTGTVTGVGTTAGFTQAFWTWDSTTNMVMAAQYIELAGNMSANAVTVTGNSGTSASPSLTAEFQDEPSGITVSVDDSTPTPTQSITITKSGSNFAGTVVAQLDDNTGTPVDVSAALTGSGATRALALGSVSGVASINNYDDTVSTVWGKIRWGQPITLTVTDNDGSGETSITITYSPDDHFAALGPTGVYVTSPAGEGDDSFVHIVSGDGEGLPELADFLGNTVPTVVRFGQFDISQNKWLAQIEHTFDVSSVSMDGQYADAFTGANGTLITAHAPNTDTVGGGYTIEKDRASSPAVSNAVTIESNRLYINDANEGAVIDVGTTDPDFSVDWPCVTGKEFVLQVRRLDDTEHIHVYVKQSTGLIRVNERVADANIAIDGDNEATTTFTNGVTYRFRVQVVGSLITVSVDDVQQVQVSSTRAPDSRATNVGMFAAGAGTFPVQFDRANVYSDYSASARTLSLSSITPNPGDSITVNVGNGVMANATYVGYLNGVAATLSNKTTAGCTLTIPGYTAFDSAGAMVASGFYRNLVFQLDDGTNTPSVTLQIVPDDPAAFAAVGTGTLVYAPAGTKFNDECYVRAGAGVSAVSPATCDFTGGRASIHVFDTVNNVWLTTLHAPPFAGDLAAQNASMTGNLDQFFFSGALVSQAAALSGAMASTRPMLGALVAGAAVMTGTLVTQAPLTSVAANVRVVSRYRRTTSVPFVSSVISASGTVTYSVVGSLPAGLVLDANTGVISGTPTVEGETLFTLRVSASASGDADIAVEWDVQRSIPRLGLPTTRNAIFVVGF